MPKINVFHRHYNLKILMVLDGSGTFGKDDFGLSEVLKALSVSPGSWVRFAITRAHRAQDYFDYSALPADERALLEPQYPSGFRFDQTGFDINAFDEVWLIGVDGVGAPSRMSDDEIKILAQFMDSGHGVFATGDHEDLGYALSGRVPRVRSMRKWYWAPPSVNSGDGPEGELRAPDGHTENRYDTVREGHDPGFQFDDQSDDVPQPIAPKLYSSMSGHVQRRYPHPLLCGPRGMIKVLPDHPHEGECVVPADLTRRYTFSGYTTAEYPASTYDGGPVAPEVIAMGTVIGGHATDFKPPVNARIFGVIGAYDGHRANVGRVSVDSTWHHFFNINLRGIPSPDPIKRQGFEASPSGHAAYEDIKSYYRNIAVWLAPKSAQKSMMANAIWNARWSYPLIEELRADVKYRFQDLVYFGQVARDALGRTASQCQTLRFILDLHALVLPELRLPFPPGDPWITPGKGPGPDPAPWFDPQLADHAVLGGALVALAQALPIHAIERAEVDSIHTALASGAAHGTTAVHQALRAQLETSGKITGALQSR